MMKRPSRQRKRGLSVSIPPWVKQEDLEELAKHAFYRGSPDHKSPGNQLGLPLRPPRPDASICDNGITREVAEFHLREAIRKGNIAWVEPREKYPRYVFGYIGDKLYIGRLTLDDKGEYKGYPEQTGIKVRGLKQ